MNRKHEQAVMLDQLGQLFGPILNVVANPQSYDLEEKRRIAARFYAEYKTFTQRVEQFCKGEPHHHYLAELNKILVATTRKDTIYLKTLQQPTAPFSKPFARYRHQSTPPSMTR
jgi:hypothetical protein